jgi:ACT domain-containing protein
MMIIKMPTLKQYLTKLKMRPEPLKRCKKADKLINEKSMQVADACRMVGVSTETYYRYKKARQ